MKREEFLKRLHPAITHIRASDNMTEETLDAINHMVEKALSMSPEELKVISNKAKAFREYEAKVAKESKHYPILVKCNGEFNNEMMKHFFERHFTPIEACNAMVEMT